MKRLELFLNRSVEEDFLSLLRKMDPVPYYTKIPEVHGFGYSEPKLGDAVWPEENVVYIIYAGQEAEAAIVAILKELRTYFPHEGMTLFSCEAAQLI